MAGGSTATLTCGPGTWTPGEPVNYGGDKGSMVNGSTSPTDPASSTGSSTATVWVPVSGTGAFTITGHGETSGDVRSATVTVAPASASASAIDPTLAHTGEDVSPWLAGFGGGALGLGLLLVLGVRFSRRRAHNS